MPIVLNRAQSCGCGVPSSATKLKLSQWFSQHVSKSVMHARTLVNVSSRPIRVMEPNSVMRSVFRLRFRLSGAYRPSARIAEVHK